MKNKKQKYACSVCGRTSQGRIPFYGDGSLVYPHRHYDKNNNPCEGNILEAVIVSQPEPIQLTENQQIEEQFGYGEPSQSVTTKNLIDFIENRKSELLSSKTKFTEIQLNDWIEIPDYKISTLNEILSFLTGKEYIHNLESITPSQSVSVEEAAKDYFEYVKDTNEGEIRYCIDDFKAGAKWQASQSTESDKKQDKCELGCIRYTGGEIKHHKDCVFYPESLTKKYDESDKLLSEARNMIEQLSKASSDFQEHKSIGNSAILSLSLELTESFLTKTATINN